MTWRGAKTRMTPGCIAPTIRLARWVCWARARQPMTRRGAEPG
ncbi:MAG: hypothetical protein M5U34_08295 [Chloroflexi bacterium]|nr:hypothetical protein [Chloroflexota bacterium]